MGLEFTKDNLTNIKGRQPSQWDALISEFERPGDRVKFDPSKVTKAQAAQGASRLRKLHPDKAFHSGYDAIDKVTFIRLRMPGEVPDKDEENEEKLEDVAADLGLTDK